MMHLPAARSVVPALALLSALLLANLPGARAQEDPSDGWAHIQGIAVGDTWSYQITGQDNGNVVNTVAATEAKISHFGKRYTTYRVDAHGEVESNQEPGNPTGVDTGVAVPVQITFDVSKWVRTTDYATVQTEGVTVIESPTETTDFETIEAFDPPLVDLVYPFTTGHRWASGAYWYLQRGGDDPDQKEVTFHATVEGPETITVPAGEFVTWRLNVTSYKLDAAYHLYWWSPEVCDLVKEERYDMERELVNTLELTSHDCSRVEKADPTYDPDWVILVQRGGTLPPDLDDHFFNNTGGRDSPGIGAALVGVWVAALGLAASARNRREERKG